MEIGVPTRGNQKLEALLAAANADDQLKAWWHVAHVLEGIQLKRRR